VLGLAVTEFLYDSMPDLAEGELAKIRASVVSSVALAQVARQLDVGPQLLLGKGETASGGASKRSILTDAMEAIIGAVFVDGGMKAASTFVLEHFADRIVYSSDGPGGDDYKTVLQELAVQYFDGLPTYVVSGDGPDHEKYFEAVVEVGGEVRGRGTGRSKKQAEQAAARQACGALGDLAGVLERDTDSLAAGGGSP
jgi:ribonuclease-3